MLEQTLAILGLAAMLILWGGLLWLLFDAARFAFRLYFAKRRPLRASARPVECHPAWVWTCDHCGRDTFERSVVAELSPEERHEAAVKLKMIEEWQSVDGLPTLLFYSRPLYVTCNFCRTRFRTVVR